MQYTTKGKETLKAKMQCPNIKFLITQIIEFLAPVFSIKLDLKNAVLMINQC